ncbi:MAG: hypothetical protein V1862_08290 [Methanobacteriota archaeon]
MGYPFQIMYPCVPAAVTRTLTKTPVYAGKVLCPGRFLQKSPVPSTLATHQTHSSGIVQVSTARLPAPRDNSQVIPLIDFTSSHIQFPDRSG